VLTAAVLQKFDPRIINGEDVALGEIPYQVSCDSLSVKLGKTAFLRHKSNFDLKQRYKYAALMYH